MSAKDGGPAFPTPGDKGSNGLSLRDWFAGQALAGLVGNDKSINPNGNEAAYAIVAYRLADAMLAEREKSQ